ncbi:MAG: UDP-N-acetylenolpyruvoylglucosamine reductase [Thermomicrobiales bacterium]|nr:MAG: UDP-N-acetylenolpyruvoylglucosamine reductase [Thermomicrobiales bacterium]
MTAHDQQGSAKAPDTVLAPGTSNGRVRQPRRTQRAGSPARSIPGYPHLMVLENSPMSLHTTWRIGGPADFLVRAPTPDDLITAVAWARDERLPVTVIGGGSNLLVGDRGIRGLVILARTPGERAERLLTVDDCGDHVVLRAGAPAPLSWVGRYCCERGWAGMEWAVGLPGTVGGATVNNAGAHGTEQKDHLVAVVVLDNNGSVRTVERDWLAPAYRYTTLKAAARPRPDHVLEVVMRLPKADPRELTRLAEEHAEYRRSTQPTGACAGSTFTNPPGDFAGRLLEAAGLKGFAVGAVAFSTKHCNFIVNSGGGTAAQVRELIAIAQERVLERFGVHLEPEIEELGEF